MGDRTPFTMTVYDTTPEEAPVFLEVIDELGLSIDWDSWRPRPGVLELCVTYTDAETSCGTVDSLGHRLIERAPNSSWEMQEDPKYDWLGSLWKYTPELGSFAAESDAQGQAVYGVEEVRRFLAEHDTIEAALAVFDQKFGVVWDERLTELAGRNEGKKVIVKELA